MWFVHTGTLQLVENPKPREEENILHYGILSHRWEGEEVTFQQMQSGQAQQEKKKGFQKIRMCCCEARKIGLDYVWIDTCCIDKTSSSALQEAVNSMFRWYRNAAICYAYLFDVQIDPDDVLLSLQSFQDSVWFRRGWTLQELLAPRKMVFYGEGWCELGDKYSLKHELSAATGISLSVLEGKIRLQDISVAERMSWASKRETERVEDRAYSLLGIFDINMPMLYGEGKKAFLRLQEEIIKYSDDHTIFAWKGIKHEYPGMLAIEPENFASCQNLVNVRLRTGRKPFSVTNRGLSITLNLRPWTLDTYLAVINCDKRPTNATERNGRQHFMGIFLRRLDEDDQYARVSVSGMEHVIIPQLEDGIVLGSRDVAVNVRQAELSTEESASVALERVNGFTISTDMLEYDSKAKPLFEIIGNLRVGRGRSMEAAPGTRLYGTVGTYNSLVHQNRIKEVTFGFDIDFNPVCYLADHRAKISDRTDLYDLLPELVTRWSNTTPEGRAKYQSSMPHGIWKLKGDRLKGLDVFLPIYSDSVVLRPGGRVRVTMKKEIMDGQLGWVFKIDERCVWCAILKA